MAINNECRIHIGYRWIHVCECTPKCILMIVVISNVYTQCTQWGQLWLQWSVCKTDGLIRRPHEGTNSQGCQAYEQTAKALRKLGSQRCKNAAGKHKAWSLYPNCFWGRVLGVLPKSYKHDRLAIAVSRLCSFVMIKSQHGKTNI